MKTQSPAQEAKPAQDQGFAQEDIHIVPFKAKRDIPKMPFKKGQGVSLAGWQFEIKHVLANGNVVLQPKGKIIG